jgi:hypothetical protein
VRIDTRRNRVVIGVDRPTPDQEQVLLAFAPGRIGLSVEPRETTIEELVVGGGDGLVPVTFIGATSLVRGVRPASETVLARTPGHTGPAWSVWITPRRAVVGWTGHGCGAIVTLVDPRQPEVTDADAGDTPCADGDVVAGLLIRARGPVDDLGRTRRGMTRAPTTDWGPMAVVHDPERAGLDAGLGPGVLTIGETCTTLEVDGRATTLVWRDWQAAWDPRAHAIRIEDDEGRQLELTSGDRLMLGGYAPWSEGADGPPAPPWLVEPDPACPPLLWLVHSVTRE